METETQTQVQTKETSETTAETTEGGEVRNRIKLDDFITVWEEVANSDNPSVQEVADRLGLKKESVQQRATKYRNPPKKDQKGNPIPVELRATPIPLTKMPRGGGMKFDSNAGASLLQKLHEQREAAKNKGSEAPTE
jgi:hypothetical protein